MQKHKVERKQINSNMCFICGVNNEAGLKIRFYETERNEVVCEFTPRDIHQSYPGRLHGGVACSVLDELLGRTIQLLEKDAWAVTADLSVKYKKPVPLNVKLIAKARPLTYRHGLLTAEGEIYLPDGNIAVKATGRFFKQNVEKIIESMDEEYSSDEMFYITDEKDSEYI